MQWLHLQAVHIWFLHKMRKIGILAGTFDPIHDGHIASAETAVRELDLETVYFMAESKPWTNKNPSPLENRIAMIQLVTDTIPSLSFLVMEEDRFTIVKTLQKIENQFKDCELYFIFGADTFLNMEINQWPELDKLLRHYIVVIEREGVKNEQIQQHAKDLGIVVATLPSTHEKHSSTDIRINPQKRELLVPESVAAYIKQNNLYKL